MPASLGAVPRGWGVTWVTRVTSVQSRPGSELSVIALTFSSGQGEDGTGDERVPTAAREGSWLENHLQEN